MTNTTNTGSVVKSPYAMTVAELQAEIALLQSVLHFKICGDPRISVTVPSTVHRIVDSKGCRDGEWTQATYPG